MNKILSLVTVLGFSALMFTSCNSNSSKGVADKWLNSFYHMDYKEAKKYSTEETQKVLDMLEQFATMVADSQKQSVKNIKIEIKNVKEEGDKSTVNYTISEDPQEKSIHLVKLDGKWLVNYSKQDKLEEEAVEETTGEPLNIGDAEGVIDTSSIQVDTTVRQ